MRRTRDVTTILGCLALAGSIALLSPGVRVVRADDSAAAAETGSEASGPTCEAGNVNGGSEVIQYLEQIQRLQRERMAASPEAAADAEGFLVLNKRGYNDNPAPLSFPGAVTLESR